MKKGILCILWQCLPLQGKIMMLPDFKQSNSQRLKS